MTSRSVGVCANSETSICTARSNRPRTDRDGAASDSRAHSRARSRANVPRRRDRDAREPVDVDDRRGTTGTRDGRPSRATRAREGARANERWTTGTRVRDARGRKGGEGGATARGEDADAGFTARGAGFFRADESAGDGARGIQRRVFGEFRDFGVRGGDGVYVGARVEGASVRERCER